MRRGSSIGVVVAQSLGLALALAGAWAIGVRPLESRLRAERSQLAALQAEGERIRHELQADAGYSEGAVRSVAEHARVLETLGSVSSDPAAVYDTIARLARDHDVRVERMEPKRSAAMAALAAGRPAKGNSGRDRTKGAPNVEAFGFAIDATGTYGGIASLLDAIQYESGLSTVMSFRIAPVRGSDGVERVRATIDSAHFTFDRKLTSATPKGDE